MVEDRASCGNYSPRFGSWFANTDLDEDGELAPRRHRDVAVAVPRVSRGHPSLWYWMIWFMKCTDTFYNPEERSSTMLEQGLSAMSAPYTN